MAVDRGGLQYRIRVEDEFSVSTQAFRAELQASREAFRDLKRELATGGRQNLRGIRDSTRALRRQRAETARLAREQARVTRAITQSQRAQVRAERDLVESRGRLARQQSADERARLQQLRARQREELRLTRERQRVIAQQARDERRQAQLIQAQQRAQAAREREIAQIRRQQQADAVAAQRVLDRQTRVSSTSEIERARRAQDAFAQAVNRTDAAGNRALFTFRRLFGVLAAFTIARELVNGFRRLVSSAFEFTAEIEKAQLGFAGIILSAAQATDAMGNILPPAEALPAALAESQRLLEDIRKDATQTVVTFPALVRAVQEGLAPGLEAGLDTDQIRTIALRTAQAASAIGLQQNQLAEELRSILQGTAQSRTTRLAPLFGGAEQLNRTVREAKRLGGDELYRVLEERLRGIAAAGDLASQTLSGLTARLGDVAQRVLTVANVEAVEEVKDFLREIFRISLRPVDLRPNPEAVAVFQNLFDAIGGVVRSLREVFQGEAAAGFRNLQDVTAGLGAVLETLGVAVAGAVQGIVRGVSTLVSVLRSATAPLRALFDTLFGGQGGRVFREVVSAALQLSTVLVGIRVILFGLVVPLRLIRGLMNFVFLRTVLTAGRLVGILQTARDWGAVLLGVRNSTGTIANLVGIIVRRALLVPALLAGVFLLTSKIVQEITGANVSLRTMANILLQGIDVALKAVAASARNFLDNLVLSFRLSGDARALELLGNASQQLEAQIRSLKQAFDEGRISEQEFRSELARLGQLNRTLGNQIGDIAADQEDALGSLQTNAEEVLSVIDGFLGEDGSLNKILSGQRDIVGDLQGEIGGLFRSIASGARAAVGALEGAGGRDVTFSARPGVVPQEERDKLAVQKEQNSVLAQQVLNAERLNRAIGRGATQDERRLQTLRNEQALLTARAAAELASIDREIAAALLAQQGAKGEEERAFAAEQLATLQNKRGLKEREFAAEVERTNEEIARQRELIEGSIGTGLRLGIENFAEQFGNQVTAGIRIATTALNQFSQLVGQTIADAFDPTTDVDIKERFGRFLKDLGQLVITELVRIAVAKIALRAVTGFVEGGQIISLARGGKIPGRGRPDLAHYGLAAQGLASGGKPKPPPGVDRRDTVPIWAQPGEFMVKQTRAAELGYGFMRWLNDAPDAPQVLRGLMEGFRFSAGRRARRGRLGFQTGGEVAGAAAGAVSRDSAAALQAAQGPQREFVPVAFVGEAEAETIRQSGGQADFMAFIREDRESIKAELGL